MKHDIHLVYASALPDAPLDMPKQQLERGPGLFKSLRAALAAIVWF